MNDTEYPLYKNAFQLFDTYGYPLILSIIECEKLEVRVDPVSFVLDAMNHGWPLDKAIATVREAWAMLLGPQAADKGAKILLDLIKQQWQNGRFSTP